MVNKEPRSFSRFSCVDANVYISRLVWVLAVCKQSLPVSDTHMVTGLILTQQHGIPFSCGYDHAPKKVEGASTIGCGVTVGRPGCGHGGSPRWKENLQWMDGVQLNDSATSVWQTFHAIGEPPLTFVHFPLLLMCFPIIIIIIIILIYLFYSPFSLSRTNVLCVSVVVPSLWQGDRNVYVYSDTSSWLKCLEAGFSDVCPLSRVYSWIPSAHSNRWVCFRSKWEK